MLSLLAPRVSEADLARDFRAGWAMVMATVIGYGTAMIERPDRVAFVPANPTRSTVFAIGVVDL
jgi:hypothetical protein